VLPREAIPYVVVATRGIMIDRDPVASIQTCVVVRDMRITTPSHPGQRSTAPISWEYMWSAPMLAVRPQLAQVACAAVTSRVNTSLNNPAAAFPSSFESAIGV
jgi:hypothetical protein